MAAQTRSPLALMERTAEAREVFDQRFSHFKLEGGSFLKEVPSQICRNACYRFKEVRSKAFQRTGPFAEPRPRKKGKAGALLTDELFRFPEDGTLEIGTAKKPLGTLRFVAHRSWRRPSSIVIREDGGRWSLSFAYDIGEVRNRDPRPGDEEGVLGIDLGVAVPAALSDGTLIVPDPEKERAYAKLERRRIGLQRKLSRGRKGSKRRARVRRRLARASRKLANCRRDFAHKASRVIVGKAPKAIAFEDLKLQAMTASAKGTAEKPGRNVRQKAGLNRAMLASGMGQIRAFCEYKAARAGKLFALVPAAYTSKTCSECGHMSAASRRSRSQFHCVSCGQQAHADVNAAGAVSSRAKDWIAKHLRRAGTVRKTDVEESIRRSVHGAKPPMPPPQPQQGRWRVKFTSTKTASVTP